MEHTTQENKYKNPALWFGLFGAFVAVSVIIVQFTLRKEAKKANEVYQANKQAYKEGLARGALKVVGEVAKETNTHVRVEHNFRISSEGAEPFSIWVFNGEYSTNGFVLLKDEEDVAILEKIGLKIIRNPSLPLGFFPIKSNSYVFYESPHTFVDGESRWVGNTYAREKGFLVCIELIPDQLAELKSKQVNTSPPSVVK